MLLSKEAKMEYFIALKRLIEMQQIFYARVKLSNDPEAKSVAENMNQAVVMLGGNANLDVREMFDDLLKKIDAFEKHVEKQ